MKYLLTVVIPTYNRANDLKECLSYVIPQVLPYKDKVHIYIYQIMHLLMTRHV